MPDDGVDGPVEDTVTDGQRADARELLSGIVEAVSAGDPVSFRSTTYGPGKLGFNYRRGSLLVEFETAVDAGDGPPDADAAPGDAVELADHAPIRTAGDRYASLEGGVLELVVEAIPTVPAASALDPVTVWPVAGEAGLYRVGYDLAAERFLYAVAFRLPIETSP